MSSVHMCFFWG